MVSRLRIGRFNSIMAIMVCAAGLADLLLAPLTNVVGLDHQLYVLVLFVPLLLPYAYARWRRLDRFRSMFECIGWSLLVQAALTPLVIAAGRSPAPLRDVFLARADALTGFSTAAVVRFVGIHAWLGRLLRIAYETATPMICVALVAPCLAGRKEDTRRFVVAGTLATILTALLFSICPAIGPWTQEAFAPDPMQASIDQSVRLLKSAGPFRMGTGIAAVVAFPSFHVIVAVLSGIGLWGFRRLRWVTAAVTIAICLSTLTTGWHYATDVAGGLAVAALSQYLANRWLSETPQANFGSSTTSSAGTASKGSAAFFHAVSPP